MRLNCQVHTVNWLL